MSEVSKACSQDETGLFKSPPALPASCLQKAKKNADVENGTQKKVLTKEVSFPDDESRLVTGFMEAPNPWEHGMYSIWDSSLLCHHVILKASFDSLFQTIFNCCVIPPKFLKVNNQQLSLVTVSIYSPLPCLVSLLILSTKLVTSFI